MKESAELLKFLVALVNATDKAGADGKYDWMDIYHYMTPLQLAGSGVEGLKLVPDELKSMDAAGQALLVAEIENILLRDKTLEAQMKESAKVLLMILKAVLPWVLKAPVPVPAVGA